MPFRTVRLNHCLMLIFQVIKNSCAFQNSAKIIRSSVFGFDENMKVRDTFIFPQNRLVVTSIDIQAVEPVDQRTRDSLQKSVQLAIEITTNSQEAAARWGIITTTGCRIGNVFCVFIFFCYRKKSRTFLAMFGLCSFLLQCYYVCFNCFYIFHIFLINYHGIPEIAMYLIILF